ncbi:MAG: FAD-dependent oxidoreductase, partial [Sediminispirochaetaceae bacterium]
MSESILVVGAGFAGLSTAALLAKKGYDVTVLEKNSSVGG